MMRFWLSLVMLTFLGMLAHIGLAAPERPIAEKVYEKDIHAEAQAWQFSGVDLPKGYVATITAKGKWKTNPLWKQAFGAGGKLDRQAAETYVKPEANEGCLLVRSGNSIRSFSKDDEVITITTPGKIYFCANDEPTKDGAARFKERIANNKGNDFQGAIPIQAMNENSDHAGFLDNIGIIKVRVAVKKAEK